MSRDVEPLRTEGHALEPKLEQPQDRGQLCWTAGGPVCPRCDSCQVYLLRSGRQRCKRCRYTFSRLTGRWIAQSRLTGEQWTMLVEMFEQEASLVEIAKCLDCAYATAFHAATVLRACILAHSANCSLLLDGGAEMLKRLCSHRNHDILRVGHHVPVFGVRETQGKVSVPVLPDIEPGFVLSLPVKKVCRGNLVYTGQVTIYDTLVFSLPKRDTARCNAGFSRSPVFIDCKPGFWPYAVRHLAAHCGVAPDHFPLYLKELEFRYNHRHERLAPILLSYLCDYLPRPPTGHPQRHRRV